MAFLVHRAERADLLVEGLADLLRTPLPDPFATELVIVPARGVERWLSQRLSHRLGHGEGREDGVCAGVDFRSPSSLVAEVLGTRDDDPWAPTALMWPLLRTVDAALGEPWADVLAQHLGHEVPGPEGDLRRGRRLAVARRLAGLFADYAVHRPAMLVDWEQGGRGDGGDGELPPDLHWQPELWRRTLAEIGVPSPVVRHAATVAALADGSAEVALPERISLFGHTRISSSEAELLAALGTHRDVHLWLPHPSDTSWLALRDSPPGGDRAADRTHLLVANPLLASMGRDLREAEGVLLAAGATDAAPSAPAELPATVLGRLQSDVRDDRAPTPAALADDSVQVHACHGPARQVEVLREVVLGLLADDDTLEPRDVLVMCPDIEAYAPLISAAFGLGTHGADAHPGHGLRVMLADRSPTQTNPLLAVLVAVVALADGRAEASRVLDLLATDPVRRRFGFGSDDLETIATWVADAGIRWAWDADARTDYGLAAYKQNTWEFGLDRMLAGVALSDDSAMLVGGTLPLDDISTTGISLVGRLCEFVARLRTITGNLTGPRDVEVWLDLLLDAVEQLADTPRGEEWQLNQVRQELRGLRRAAGEPVELRLADVRSLLDDQLGGRPTRASFRTGTLTVCTMTPMRSVPHRVVCLVGLDDGVFPRGASLDGDDVLARLPRVGEPDARSQDRQLLLDAVMSATERLVVTYTGFDEASGQERPAPVPLRELLDVLDTYAPDPGVLRRHRAQPFHADYLRPSSVLDRPLRQERPDERFSFDPHAARAARAATGERVPVETWEGLRAAPLTTGDVELADLVDAVTTPVKAFVKRRLDVQLVRDEEESGDGIPIDLGFLGTWQVGDRMLRDQIAGSTAARALEVEWSRGTLPPGRLGWRQASGIANEARVLAEARTALVGDDIRRSVEIDVEVHGRRVVGVVPDVYGNRHVPASFSRLKGKPRMQAWIALVALAAQDPDVAWEARAVGHGKKEVVDIAAYGTPAEPLDLLRDLVAFHDLALARPLPFGVDAGLRFAELLRSRARNPENDRSLGWAWESEAKAPEMRLVWGRTPTLADLLREKTDGGLPLFGTLARSLWTPALEAGKR